MTTQRIPLPFNRPPLSLNDRGHWATRYRKEKLVRDQVALLARHHKIKAVDAAVVTFHWRPAVNRPRDQDNVMASVKPCVDALVRSGILPSDTHDIVTPAVEIHPVVKGEAGATWITIEEVW